MKFSITREQLLRPLTLVSGAVERRQTMPILSNLLIKLTNKNLEITGTDLEVELSTSLPIQTKDAEKGEITVPARKFVDICKSLPDGSTIKFHHDNGKVVIQSGRSRYTLSTLPAVDFPSVQKDKESISIILNQEKLSNLIGRTSFSMAQQDVRYYLNGMLWEINKNRLKAVATDGHRLAISEIQITGKEKVEKKQYILPRKGIIELSRLLSKEEETITVELGLNHIRATTTNMTFVSKLVEGKFPDYERVLPKGGNKEIIANTVEFKAALARSAILSNEKFKGIRFSLSNDLVNIQASNPEQEEAQEDIIVNYQGDRLEMGFNVSYLIEALGVISSNEFCITLSDSASSALIEDTDKSNNSQYVVMPMRL